VSVRPQHVGATGVARGRCGDGESPAQAATAPSLDDVQIESHHVLHHKRRGVLVVRFVEVGLEATQPPVSSPKTPQVSPAVMAPATSLGGHSRLRRIAAIFGGPVPVTRCLTVGSGRGVAHRCTPTRVRTSVRRCRSSISHRSLVSQGPNRPEMAPSGAGPVPATGSRITFRDGPPNAECHPQPTDPRTRPTSKTSFTVHSPKRKEQCLTTFTSR
jgi:hypothetical protein